MHVPESNLSIYIFICTVYMDFDILSQGKFSAVILSFMYDLCCLILYFNGKSK